MIDDIETICENGIFSLLHNVHIIDNLNYKNSIEIAYEADEILSEANNFFLGQYYFQRNKNPIHLHNATNIFTYFRFLESKDHDSFFRIYLYLLGYLSFIEISDPLILIYNCLDYLENNNGNKRFDFSILDNMHSITQKLNAINKKVKSISDNDPACYSKIQDFITLFSIIKIVFDNKFRNAIAHADYKIDNSGRIIIKSNNKNNIENIEDVKKMYIMALDYIRGFRKSIDNFSTHILPGNRVYISWGPRY